MFLNVLLDELSTEIPAIHVIHLITNCKRRIKKLGNDEMLIALKNNGSSLADF